MIGLRWTRLSRVTCIRRFHHHVGSLILMSGMNGRINSAQEGITIMANSWIRCTSFPSPLSVVDATHVRIHSAHVVNEYRRRIFNTEDSTWLTQASHIFNRLEIIMDFENFGIFPVSRSSNCNVHFPQFQWISSTTVSVFPDRQTICLPATSFCAPWSSSKPKIRHAFEFQIVEHIGLSTHREFAH
jgi:hypothetical protein